jgi:hypothetical protein
MRRPLKPRRLGATEVLLPSLVLVMSERRLLRNASRRSNGNGCSRSSCFPSHTIFTHGAQLADKVKKLARKTHKDRVHEFNTKLESLSEHHDIPKVNITGHFFGASSNRIISLRLVLDKVSVEHSGVFPHSSFLSCAVACTLLVDVVFESIPFSTMAVENSTFRIRDV